MLLPLACTFPPETPWSSAAPSSLSLVCFWGVEICVSERRDGAQSGGSPAVAIPFHSCLPFFLALDNVLCVPLIQAYMNEDASEQYDRQIRLWGVDAQKRMSGSKVLFSGINGVSKHCCNPIESTRIELMLVCSRHAFKL